MTDRTSTSTTLTPATAMYTCGSACRVCVGQVVSGWVLCIHATAQVWRERTDQTCTVSTSNEPPRQVTHKWDFFLLQTTHQQALNVITGDLVCSRPSPRFITHWALCWGEGDEGGLWGGEGRGEGSHTGVGNEG